MDLQQFQEIAKEYVDNSICIKGDHLLKGDQVNTVQATLGISSLDMVELIIDIETNFNITLTEDEVQKVKTVDDMILLINNEIESENIRTTKREEAKKLLFGDNNEMVKI